MHPARPLIMLTAAILASALLLLASGCAPREGAACVGEHNVYAHGGTRLTCTNGTWTR